MSEKHNPCRVDQVSGWCREHDAKAGLPEALRCCKNVPDISTPSERERLTEAVIEKAKIYVEFSGGSVMRDALAALQALDARDARGSILTETKLRLFVKFTPERPRRRPRCSRLGCRKRRVHWHWVKTFLGFGMMLKDVYEKEMMDMIGAPNVLLGKVSA